GFAEGTTKGVVVPSTSSFFTGPRDKGSMLSLISQHESKNQNVNNYKYKGGQPSWNAELGKMVKHTASGYYQITDTNWRQYAPQAGISLSQYPRAISAPRELQAKVAELLLNNSKGIRNWSDYNPDLRAALGKMGSSTYDFAPPTSPPMQ